MGAGEVASARVGAECEALAVDVVCQGLQGAACEFVGGVDCAVGEAALRPAVVQAACESRRRLVAMARGDRVRHGIVVYVGIIVRISRTVLARL